jgi:hypothetical protein
MNKEALGSFEFANLTSNLSLRPIGLNATINNKAKNNRNIEYLG